MRRAELFEIGKSWALVSLVFTIAYGRDALGLGFFQAAIYLFFVASLSALCAGAGFVAHELAHKAVAKRHGLKARYMASKGSGAISILAALGGLIILAPGAVHIRGERANPKAMAGIAAAGPLANLVISLAFLFSSNHFDGIIVYAARFGYRINAWLALFNLVPFPGFDGSKIIRQKPLLYATLSAASAYMVFLT